MLFRSLTLEDIVLLDRVQKRKPITDQQARHLKVQGLIEGRKPNYHISEQLADHSAERAQYIRNRAFDDQYYKKQILEYLEVYKEAKRLDIDMLILDKLPDILDEKQKSNKVKNLLQAMRRAGLIDLDGRTWRMSKR